MLNYKNISESPCIIIDEILPCKYIVNNTENYLNKKSFLFGRNKLKIY